MIRGLVAVVLSIMVLSGAAEAQQKVGTGGTCSSHRSGCDTRCQGNARKIPNCMASCTNYFNSCMQTGIWDGSLNKFTEVQRQ